jgi:hypothetical protein
MNHDEIERLRTAKPQRQRLTATPTRIDRIMADALIVVLLVLVVGAIVFIVGRMASTDSRDHCERAYEEEYLPRNRGLVTEIPKSVYLKQCHETDDMLNDLGNEGYLE